MTRLESEQIIVNKWYTTIRNIGSAISKAHRYLTTSCVTLKILNKNSDSLRIAQTMVWFSWTRYPSLSQAAVTRKEGCNDIMSKEKQGLWPEINYLGSMHGKGMQIHWTWVNWVLIYCFFFSLLLTRGTPQVSRGPIHYWRSVENNSRKNEGMEPKQKQYPAVDMTGDRNKVRCCKEQYCIRTWNVRSMNQGKLEVVKQEMARVNVDILGISELKWTGMGEFNSDDHYLYYCGRNPSEEMEGPSGSTKQSEMQYSDAISKTTEWSLFVSKANHSISQ